VGFEVFIDELSHFFNEVLGKTEEFFIISQGFDDLFKEKRELSVKMKENGFNVKETVKSLIFF